ncbi:hypothetical protein ACLOJK_019907 [Asimina triloba]
MGEPLSKRLHDNAREKEKDGHYKTYGTPQVLWVPRGKTIVNTAQQRSFSPTAPSVQTACTAAL